MGCPSWEGFLTLVFYFLFSIWLGAPLGLFLIRKNLLLLFNFNFLFLFYLKLGGGVDPFYLRLKGDPFYLRLGGAGRDPFYLRLTGSGAYFA